MKITHRYNSEERQHFLINQQHSFKLKPKLLYSGILSRQKGWKDNFHTHSFAEVIFVMKGNGQIFYNDQTENIEKGDIIIYNAGLPHREQSSDSEPFELLFIGLDKLEITGLPYNHLIPSNYNIVFHSSDMEEIFRMLFSNIVDEMAGKDRFYIEIAKNTTITLVMYLYRLINKSNNALNILEKDSSILNDIILFIDEHYLEPISLDDIAIACHISKYYLSHMFSDIKKQTVMQYIMNKRLEKARQLLDMTSLTVEEIALLSGFNNSSYFSRVFKEAYQITPLNYRKRKTSKNQVSNLINK